MISTFVYGYPSYTFGKACVYIRWGCTTDDNQSMKKTIKKGNMCLSHKTYAIFAQSQHVDYSRHIVMLNLQSSFQFTWLSKSSKDLKFRLHCYSRSNPLD